MSNIKISQLFIFPLKSGKGEAVSEIALNRMGIVNDRRFMLVDENGHFLTQRQHFKMALIDATPVDNGLKKQFANEANSFRFSAPGMDELIVPTPSDTKSSHCKVKIWNDICDAIDCGNEVEAWFSDYLKSPARLVYMPEKTFRSVDPNYCDDERSVNFADGFPFLLIGQASLDDLNKRLDNKIEMNRFRPNLVISGSEPFAEDNCSEISVEGDGNLRFNVAKACSRCLIPGINPETGQYEPEVLKVLGGYRQREGAIYFGQNLLGPAEGIIKLGDKVKLK